MRAELAALFAEFAYAGKREHLKAAAVGEHGAVETVEAVQTAGALQDVEPGTQVEMIGVAENDFGVDVVLEFMQVHPLHAADGADGHEDGRVYVAVVGVYESGSCGTVLGRMLQVVGHV